MPTFAIGDVHGCFDSLRALLDRLPFDAARDRLWMVGDLVNRGPRSLQILRWAREAAERMGERFVTVLGNHDLHLLRRAVGLRQDHPLDTLRGVIDADDGAELVEWLARRPLLHRDRAGVMVHAGLPPGWEPQELDRRARRAESLLRHPDTRRAVLDREAGDEPGRELAHGRETLGWLASVRCLDAATGEPRSYSGPLDGVPPGYVPWFRHTALRHGDAPVVFGHWSALGFHREGGENGPRVACLDSGCVWGRGLTALRLDDGETFFQPTVEPADELPARDW